MKRRTLGEKYGRTPVVKKTNKNGNIIPEVLYKYMSLERFFRSFDKYLAGNLWFSDWDSMNDPMEGVFDLSKGNAVDIKNIDKITENRKIEKNEKKKQLKKAKICSLSYYNNSLPMWAHYANNHTGVCIGIKINEIELENKKIKLRKIVYDRINPSVEEMGTNDILKVLSHKLDDWDYENEWRLIIMNGNSGMRQVGEVKEIIFGRRCELVHSKCFLWPENIKEKVSNFFLDNEWEYIERQKDNSIEIVGYKGSECNIAIPSMITSDEKPVVAIGNLATPNNEITSIKIPGSIIEINEFAFESCAKLSSIKVVQKNPQYSSNDGVLFSKNFDTLKRFPFGKKGTCYQIPDSVRTIADYAFENCTKLIKVNIHGNVTDIGHLAFYGCTKLQSIDVDRTNSKYSSQDGVLFDKKITSLITYPCVKEGAYTIPEGVTEIWTCAFFGCEGLNSVDLTDVKTVKMEAFRNCTELTTVIGHERVESIECRAFSGCPNLDLQTQKDILNRFGPEVFE